MGIDQLIVGAKNTKYVLEGRKQVGRPLINSLGPTD